MGMGGGGGGGVPPAGLTALQKEQFGQGTRLYDKYMRWGKPAALEMSGLARGGLLNWGMNEAEKGLQTPAMGAGFQAREAARYGVQLTPEQQAEATQTAALTKASQGVRLKNQTRGALVETQRDLNLG